MHKLTKNNEKVVLHYVKLEFHKVNQYTGAKCLTHITKSRKDNQLQSLELPSSIFM